MPCDLRILGLHGVARGLQEDLQELVGNHVRKRTMYKLLQTQHIKRVGNINDERMTVTKVVVL